MILLNCLLRDRSNLMKKVFIVKLGGSLITNKRKPYTARRAVIQRLAEEIKKIKGPFIIAHGVGSFAHTSAKKYGGMDGYSNRQGIAKVAFDVMEIHHIVMEIFIKNKLPVIGFSPRSFLLTKEKKLYKTFFDPLFYSLEQGLIPVVYGDVIWDSVTKTTIFSGERTMLEACIFLQKQGYKISKVVQLSDVDGVLDNNKKIITEITKNNWKIIKPVIINNKKQDVTGGMAHKVENALAMTQYGIQTWIVNGNSKEKLSVLLNSKKVTCTVVR
jgi:isopentenyl phosphate kinase